MPRRWTRTEEEKRRQELRELYVHQNKTIFAVGRILGIHWVTVYDRLHRLGIPTNPNSKPWVVKHRTIRLPPLSEEFAELTGILLGDGHINFRTGQITIDGNSKTDLEYAHFLIRFLRRLTGRRPGFFLRKSEHDFTVFMTSVSLLQHLSEHGLIHENKVRAQARMPPWVWQCEEWLASCVRGLHDTDGSIYKLRYGTQWSFTNRSLPLLYDVRDALERLRFSPSRVGSNKVYLTRKEDLKNYFRHIGSHNPKHLKRARAFHIL